MTLPLLFPGIPGGIELLVIVLMMAILLVVPFALVVGAYLFGKRRGRAESSEDDPTESVK